MGCKWPEGACACMMAEQEKPDHHGRVWMHCESGLNLSKASMTRFVMFCLTNEVEIGSFYAFDPTFPRSLVVTSVRIKPEQIAAFEAETGGKLREPPRVLLNSDT